MSGVMSVVGGRIVNPTREGSGVVSVICVSRIFVRLKLFGGGGRDVSALVKGEGIFGVNVPNESAKVSSRFYKLCR